MADSLSTKIDALISGADALSAAADSVATITSGSDVLVSNFDHVEEVFDNLQLFLSELKTNSWYAPVGLISPFGGLTAPTGWLLCDGSAVSQTTYSALHTVLGANAYGTDSGGNFYLPDLKGRTVFGLNAANADVDARSDSDGASETNRSPKHAHTSSLTATSGGVDHTHTYSIVAQTNASTGYNTGLLRFADTNATLGGYGPSTSGASAYLHTHPVSGTIGVGSGTANTVPYAVANYIIKW